MRAEGWCWVEPVDHFDYGALSRYGRVYPVPVARSAEEAAELAALQHEAEQIELHHEEEPPDAVAARLEEIDARVEALSETIRAFKPEEMAVAGVFVGVDHNGDLRQEKGYVRPEDKRKARRAAGQPAESAPRSRMRSTRRRRAFQRSWSRTCRPTVRPRCAPC